MVAAEALTGTKSSEVAAKVAATKAGMARAARFEPVSGAFLIGVFRIFSRRSVSNPLPGMGLCVELRKGLSKTEP